MQSSTLPPGPALLAALDALVLLLDPQQRITQSNYSQQKMQKKEELAQAARRVVAEVNEGQEEGLEHLVQRIQVLSQSRLGAYLLVFLEVILQIISAVKAGEPAVSLAQTLLLQVDLNVLIQEEDLDVQRATSVEVGTTYLVYKELIGSVGQIVGVYLSQGLPPCQHLAVLTQQVVQLLQKALGLQWQGLVEKVPEQAERYRLTQMTTSEACLNYLSSTIPLKGAGGEEVVKTQQSTLIGLCQELGLSEKGYLRKAALEVLETVVHLMEAPAVEGVAGQLTEILRRGNSDADILSRFQATKLVGHFLLLGKKHQWACQEAMQRSLLMTICFNRYQNAESFKEQSLVIWKKVVGQEGKNLLNQYSKESLSFYLQESSSANWMIRECSCRCINELYRVVEDKSVFTPHREALVQALANNMDDMRSSVRSYAFVALKTTLPLLFESSLPEEFLPRLTLHLADQLLEVRKDTISILHQLYGQPSLGQSVHNHLLKAFEYQQGRPHDHSMYHSHANDLLDGMAMFLNSKEEPAPSQSQREELCELVFSQFSAHILEENVAKVRDSILRQICEISRFLGSNKQYKKVYQSLFQALQVLLSLSSTLSSPLVKDNLKAIVGVLGLNQIKAKLGPQGETQFNSLSALVK